MQVNTVAHADRMRRAGLTRADMFNPNTNIEWGTLFMRQFHDRIVRALGGKPIPGGAPLSTVVRLAYKGPKFVLDDIADGVDPRLRYPGPTRRWREALDRVSALV